MSPTYYYKVNLHPCKMHYFLPSVTDITLRDEYKLVTNWDDILTHIYREQQEKLCLAGSKKYVDVESFWTKERPSYPLSLLYALQSLSGCYLGQDQDPLEELTTLTIHVIINPTHNTCNFHTLIQPKCKICRISQRRFSPFGSLGGGRQRHPQHGELDQWLV